MLQAEIETRLILDQSSILPQAIVILNVNDGIVYLYLFT